ncbi:flagellar hook-basal body complex protein FliE [Comamonas nitrativorans]|uniref:Flagellar hook-basal body complex protein FliE n=1 Tax=Comamonas nitrativorans TaxID=108437 RepID=A0ABV9GUM7_9BURK
MDLRIQNTQSALSALRGTTDAAARLTKPLQSAEAEGHGFGSALENALRSVSAAQNHSSHLQREVQLENPAVSLEETMVAMQKAQIGFQATLHVRNRLVQAYTDVMNMQV